MTWVYWLLGWFVGSIFLGIAVGKFLAASDPHENELRRIRKIRHIVR